MGGVGVGWWKSVVGPSSLCLAQKIMKNDVSYMGVKKLLVLGGWRVGSISLMYQRYRGFCIYLQLCFFVQFCLTLEYGDGLVDDGGGDGPTVPKTTCLLATCRGP